MEYVLTYHDAEDDTEKKFQKDNTETQPPPRANSIAEE